MINWDNPRKRRDRLFIIAEILDIAKDGALKTQIMYRANLSFAQLNTYLDLLLDTQLLERTQKSKRTIYITTRKGSEYMESYKDIIETLSSSNSNGDCPRIKGGPTIYWIKKP